MTEQRIAQITLSSKHENPTLKWKQTGYAELETAMNSPVWKLDPKRLLQLANGKSDTNGDGGRKTLSKMLTICRRCELHNLTGCV